MKESERKEKKRETGELKASPPKFIAELIDVHYRLRLIYAQNKEKLQKKPKQKLLQGLK